MIALAVLISSFAAVLIRLALVAGMAPMVVVGTRLMLAWLILTPLVVRRYHMHLRRMSRRDHVLAVLAGIWMASHFLLMTIALENSSVLLVQTIVNTGPLWVALIEVTVLKARLPRLVWMGLVIAFFGGGIIGLASAGANTITGEQPVLGALLSFSSAAAGAVYMTIGRKVRASTALAPYIWHVLGGGALTMLIVIAATGTPLLGYSMESYFWVMLLALGPQLIAHSGFNYALAYIPATLVTLSTQVVSVTAAIIAFFLFAEVPGVLEAIGSVVIIAGVMLAVVAQRKPHPPES